MPPSFSWVDHRLVRDHHISRCDCRALALYLLLVTVSDCQGLSYYSDAGLCRRLNLEATQLRAARTALLQAELIAFRKPLYQVLSLEDPKPAQPPLVAEPRAQVQSVGQILRRVMEGGEG